MKINYINVVDAYRLLKNRKGVTLTSFLVFMIMILCGTKNYAQTYPFDGLPDTIVATLNIETTQTEPYRNTLLGYNISRFTTADQKDIIKKFDPITIRFPMGIFSNWYDWRTDDFTYYSPWTDEDHQPVVDGQSPAGIAGLELLNNEKAEANNVGYDFLITWNMSYDGYKGNDDTTNTESIARLTHYKDMGFDVTGIEFGNELFYRNQRSPFVPDEAGFLARAKKLSKDLKAVDPDVKISIPLIFRNSATNPNWNKLIAADGSYFDAISVHKYIGVDVDNRLDLSSIGYEFGLAARLSLEPAVTFARKFAQDKPVWLTEWGVDVGTSPTGNAASCLGMADCYIYMSENQDIYQRANWFSANGSANQLIKLETGTFSTIQYPLTKTGYGFTYDIIRSVFENSTLLNSTVSTSSKLELIGSSVDAVSARVVVKDGKILILALNLTDKPAEFHLNKDGSILEHGYKMESVKFNGIDDLPLIPWDDNPFNFYQKGDSMVMLPPLSINKITLNGPVEYAVNFETPVNRDEIDLGSNFVVEANAGSEVTGVSLFLDDELVRNITSAPYKWGVDTTVDPMLNNLEVGFYNLKLVATNADTISYSDLISIEIVDTAKQYPYKDTIQIPGTIEAEDYDLGVEGQSFHDTDTENKGGVYRTDAVDIGEFSPGLYNIGWSANGEWLEYTINVAETGMYDFDIVYSAGRTAPAKIGAEFFDESIVLFDGFNLPITSDWGIYDTLTINNVTLTEGIHVLRLNITVSGCNLDKMLVRPTKTPYNGVVNLPATVEAEDFDLGGEQYSYHDSDNINDFGKYRNDAVDIKEMTSGYAVANTAAGEWLDYTIVVPETDLYDFDIVYSTVGTDSAVISAEFSDANFTLFNELVLPSTTNADVYDTISYKKINLTEGTHVLRLSVIEGGFNFDKFNIEMSILFELTTTISGSGNIDKTPDLDRYDPGALVTLTANAGTGYQFKDWSGDFYSTDSIITVKMDSTINMTANFELTSSINQIHKVEMKVYPNPSVNGQFQLSEYQAWEVYSIDGLKILEGSGTTVDISSYPKGFFLLKTELGVERILYK